jgi:hypothetical protein
MKNERAMTRCQRTRLHTFREAPDDFDPLLADHDPTYLPIGSRVRKAAESHDPVAPLRRLCRSDAVTCRRDTLASGPERIKNALASAEAGM